MYKEAFKALLETGEEEGLTRKLIVIPGEAATFIAMVSMAEEGENARGVAGDRRLR
jgi:hypothetical protein